MSALTAIAVSVNGRLPFVVKIRAVYSLSWGWGATVPEFIWRVGRYCTRVYLEGEALLYQSLSGEWGATVPEFILRVRRYCTRVYLEGEAPLYQSLSWGWGATVPEFIWRVRRYCTRVYLEGEALLYQGLSWGWGATVPGFIWRVRRHYTRVYLEGEAPLYQSLSGGWGATVAEFILRVRRYCTRVCLEGEALLHFSMASRSLLFYGSGFINIIGEIEVSCGNHEQSAVYSAQTPAPFRGEVPGGQTRQIRTTRLRPQSTPQILKLNGPEHRPSHAPGWVHSADDLTLLVEIFLFAVSYSWLRQFCSESHAPS